MSASLPISVGPWSGLASLVGKARQAQTTQELLFVMANDTFLLLPYRSALVFSAGARLQLVCASGLAFIDRHGAYGAWAEKVVECLRPRLAAQRVFRVQDVPEHLAPAWAEYWPEQVHLHAVPGRHGELAWVLYLTDHVWPESADGLLATLHQVHGVCLQSLQDRRRRFGVFRRQGGQAPGQAARKWVWAGVALTLLAMALPVRQFVIAPAEIVSLDSTTVTSPIEGIVAEMVAKPNQPVKKGDVLVRLDDTAIRNRLESARQALTVARADFMAGAHRAFAAQDRNTDAGVLKGRIQERQAEVAFLSEQLAMLDIRAGRDGAAVYGQANDWVGRPVSAGQRIMELANESKLGVNIWVPVADAINLERGAPLQVLLYADPLQPLQAHIEEASYHALKSPDGVAAFRVRASLAPETQPRLGLRGSAKISGESVSLGYFIFRRPLSVARQWLGV